MKSREIARIRTLEQLCVRLRYLILSATTAAGSGHPTSSLSAVELMAGLLFGGFFRADLSNPAYPNNDRLIFSKGHASPLLYALYAVAQQETRNKKQGPLYAVSEEELLTLRKFDSRLEGHPSMRFPYTEAATGSLGQGLSIGVGMALNAKYLDNLPYTTYVLLGDSEMAEGSNWEALQIAAQYSLDNLVGIIDVNRLGERGETMYGHRLGEYEKRVKAFGWNTIVVKDGNNIRQVIDAYQGGARFIAPVRNGNGRPTMIIAKTIKGKGVSFLENKEGRHGKALSKEEYEQAIRELGAMNHSIFGTVRKPTPKVPINNYQLSSKQKLQKKVEIENYPPEADPSVVGKLKISSHRIGDMVATRDVYGSMLAELVPKYPNIVVLDAELSDSTRVEQFKNVYPERFFEMFIAEQNMVGVALGLSARGKIPFVSTFAAFLTRAFDQIRMSSYSNGNVKYIGTHAGVAIGEDGPSQMGLEGIALFRTLFGSVVLYPGDAIAAQRLIHAATEHRGNVYIQLNRTATPILYSPQDRFRIGGSVVVRRSRRDLITIVAAGVTLHEALAAHGLLRAENIFVRVVDVYSIQPIDGKTLQRAARETNAIITVEDQYAAGGVGEAVRSALGNSGVKVYSLAVRKMPRSGKPQELLAYEGIDRWAIVKMVKSLMK